MKHTYGRSSFNLWMVLAVAAVGAGASASAQVVTIKATGTVTRDAAGCNGFTQSFCDFFYEAPSPQFVARFPPGAPISILYNLDLATAGTEADSPPYLQVNYDAIKSGSVTVGNETFQFGPGAAGVAIPIPPDAGQSSGGYRVQYNPPPGSGSPLDLLWGFQGDGVFTDLSVPKVPHAPWTSIDMLTFSLTNPNADYMVFTLNDVRQVPEPCSMLLACLSALAVLPFRRPRTI